MTVYGVDGIEPRYTKPAAAAGGIYSHLSVR